MLNFHRIFRSAALLGASTLALSGSSLAGEFPPLVCESGVRKLGELEVDKKTFKAENERGVRPERRAPFKHGSFDIYLVITGGDNRGAAQVNYEIQYTSGGKKHRAVSDYAGGEWPEELPVLYTENPDENTAISLSCQVGESETTNQSGPPQ